MMFRRSELRKLRAVMDLDNDKCVQGYCDGRDGKENQNPTDFSYTHGWKNGMSDSGRRKIDSTQRLIAREFVRNKAYREQLLK